MTLERGPLATSVIDVLDHILDKGVVLDAWVYVSVAGVDLVTIEARVVVASIETYLTRAVAISECVRTRPGLRPSAQPPPVDVQLRHVAERMTRGLFEPQMHQRRVDDQVRDERHDLYAETISSHTRFSNRNRTKVESISPVVGGRPVTWRSKRGDADPSWSRAAARRSSRLR